MTTTDREPLSLIDNFWLRQDRPYNHMTITSVFILADRVDLETVQNTFETRCVLPFPRFQQRPVNSLRGAYWETDTRFEISNHFQRVRLSGAQAKEELEALVSNLVSTPLDPTKPLWDWRLVENYQGGSALIWRVHHSYADGMGMIHLLLAMTDKVPRVPVPAPPLAARQDAGDEPGDTPSGSLFQPVSDTLGAAVNAGRGLLAGGVDALSHPSETLAAARQGVDLASGYARQGRGFASEAGKLLLAPDDPPTRFRGRLGVAKRVAWMEPLPLDDVKVIGRIHDCTINDVLLACVAGALRAYLVAQGDPVDSQLTIHAAVPVNLRPATQSHQLGNKFGMVLLTLPLGIEDPLERLVAVHQHMEEIKTSYQAIMSFGLMEVMGLGPSITQALAMNRFSHKATAVMTNVPGPPQPLYFAGRQCAELMFWVPQSGSVGMGVSIFSYNHRVHLGLITDQHRVRDPATIIREFRQAFEELLLLTMMGPWDKPAAATGWSAAVKGPQ